VLPPDPLGWLPARTARSIFPTTHVDALARNVPRSAGRREGTLQRLREEIPRLLRGTPNSPRRSASRRRAPTAVTDSTPRARQGAGSPLAIGSSTRSSRWHLARLPRFGWSGQSGRR